MIEETKSFLLNHSEICSLLLITGATAVANHIAGEQSRNFATIPKYATGNSLSELVIAL